METKATSERQERQAMLLAEARHDRMTDMEERLYIDFFMEHFPNENSDAYRAEWRRRFKIDLGLMYGDKCIAKWLCAWIRGWMNAQITGLDA